MKKFIVLTVFLFLPFSVFSKEDQKRCGVIFGAAVWKDDIPSQALYDRIKAGVDLYNASTVNCLVLSGGASTYGAHEVDVMKNIILDEAIPKEALFLDYNGVNTESTIRNLPSDIEHYVFVSNDFHLPRIMLLAKKIGIKSFDTHAATYNQGNYNRQKWFHWRELGGNIYTLFFVW